MHMAVHRASAPFASPAPVAVRDAADARRAHPVASAVGQILVLLGAILASEATLVGLSPAAGVATFFLGVVILMSIMRSPRPE